MNDQPQHGWSLSHLQSIYVPLSGLWKPADVRADWLRCLLTETKRIKRFAGAGRQAGVGGGERADYLIGSESARGAEIEISSRVGLMREYDAVGVKLDCTKPRDASK